MRLFRKIGTGRGIDQLREWLTPGELRITSILAFGTCRTEGRLGSGTGATGCCSHAAQNLGSPPGGRFGLIGTRSA